MLSFARKGFFKYHIGAIFHRAESGGFKGPLWKLERVAPWYMTFPMQTPKVVKINRLVNLPLYPSTVRPIFV